MLEAIRRVFRGKAAGGGASGPVVTELVPNRVPPKRQMLELIRAYKATPWLRAVASAIATPVAATDWIVSVPTRGGQPRRSRAIQQGSAEYRRKTLATLRKKQELVDVDDHPVVDFILAGNPLLSGQACLRLTQTWLDIQGEAFWYLIRDGGKTPACYMPIPPHWVKEIPGAGSPAYLVSVPGGVQKRIAEEDVIYFRDPDPENPYGRGTGVGEALADELDVDEYASKYLKAFFHNDAVPAALVSLEGAKAAEVTAAEASWMQKFRGVRNASRVAFVNSKIDVKQFQSTMKDMQMVGLRDNVRDTVISVFNVPPEIVGVIENSNRATIEAAVFLLASRVVDPRVSFLRSVLQLKLVPIFDENAVLDYVSPIPEDREYTLKVAQASPGALTRGEWRELAGYTPHDNGIDDVYLVPLQYIERPLRPSAPAPAPAAPAPTEEPTEEEPTEEEPEPRALTSTVRKDLDAADVERIIAALQPDRLTDEVEETFREYIEKHGGEAMAALGLDASSFSLLNPLVKQHLKEFAGSTIEGINDTTRQALRDTLTEGVRAGEGIRDLTKRVREVFDQAETYRAARIARTEVTNSANFANYSAMEQSGLVKKRAWVATRDDRTRESHADLDGEEADIDEPFKIGDDEGMHPGDFGKAENVVNCRCTTVAVLDGEEPKTTADLDAVWKRFDASLVEWEDEAVASFRRGFSAQREDVIAALNDAE